MAGAIHGGAVILRPGRAILATVAAGVLAAGARAEESETKPVSAEMAAYEESLASEKKYYEDFNAQIGTVLDGLEHADAIFASAPDDYFEQSMGAEASRDDKHRLFVEIVPLNAALHVLVKNTFPTGGLISVTGIGQKDFERLSPEDKALAMKLSEKVDAQAKLGNYYITQAAAVAKNVQKLYGGTKDWHPSMNSKDNPCYRVLEEMAFLSGTYVKKLKSTLASHKKYYDQFLKLFRPPDP